MRQKLTVTLGDNKVLIGHCLLFLHIIHCMFICERRVLLIIYNGLRPFGLSVFINGHIKDFISPGCPVHLFDKGACTDS